LIERLPLIALDISKSCEQDMTEEVHMTTQDNPQNTGRNDPAIDQDASHQGQDPAQGGSAQTQVPGQDNPAHGNQSQDNHGATSTDNSYTPDFAPEEAESADDTSEHNQTGETDADVDTQGG
jgi:hypothetical protein